MADIAAQKTNSADYCWDGWDEILDDEAGPEDYPAANDEFMFDGVVELIKPSVPKPVPPKVAVENIPEILKNRPQWVCWKYVWKGERWTKMPHQPSGRLASSSDPGTWVDFDTAVRAYETDKFNGIGFCFADGDGLAGIDIDHCLDRDTKQITRPEAQDIIHQFLGKGYIEVSPGGDGIRIYALGKHGRSGKANGNLSWIEAYCFPSNRFLTITGRRIEESASDPLEAQEQLDWLYETFFKKAERERPEPAPSVTKAAIPAPKESDAALIQRIRQNEKAKLKFSQLFDFGELVDAQTGEICSDHSRADAALCELLAFWTNRDAEQMDRIFRQSALMRDKWDEKRGARTYGEMTIENANEYNLKNGGRTVGGMSPGGADAGGTPDAGGDRTEIRVKAGDRHQAVDAIQKVLAKNDTYQIDGILYGLVTNDGVPEPSKLIKATTLGTYLARFARVMKFSTTKDRGWVAAELGQELAKAFVDEQHYPDVPRLAGIARQPFLRADGTVRNTPGYDTETKMFCSFGADAFPIIAEPTRADAEAALARIASLWDEVDFASESDRAAAVCGALTAAVRKGLPSAPLLLHTSHLEGTGSGKNYSENIIEQFATVAPHAALTYKFQRSELDKAIFAHLLTFPVTMRFDELPLGSQLSGSPMLLNMLSEPTVNDRVLGATKTAVAPSNVLVQLSGNAVVVTGDMRRRVLEIFYAPVEGRQFTRDPLKEIIDNRWQFVADALTVIRAWLKSEVKAESPPIKGFKQWDHWCRQPLIWLGMEDPATSLIENMSTTDGGVVGAEDVATFIHWLRDKFDAKWFTAREVFDKMEENSGMGTADVRMAARRIAQNHADGRQVDSVIIGTILAQLREMSSIGGWQIRRKDQSRKSKAARKWRVIRKGGEATEE